MILVSVVLGSAYFKGFFTVHNFCQKHKRTESQPLVNPLPAIDGKLSDFVGSLPTVHFGHKGSYRLGVGWLEVGYVPAIALAPDLRIADRLSLHRTLCRSIVREKISSLI